MSRKQREVDALILDFLDYERPVGRTVVHRIRADRLESQYVAQRVRELERSGLVQEVKKDRLVKVDTPGNPPGD